MPAALRVLVVDDDRLFTEGLTTLLGRDSRIGIVGSAENGGEAIERVDQMRPDIVLMDLDLPVLDRVEATRRIRARYPEPTVVVFTGTEAEERITAAVLAGAARVVRKARAAVDLVDEVLLARDEPLQ